MEVVKVLADQYQDLRNQMALKKREIEDLQSRLNDGSHGRLLAEIKSLESTVGMLVFRISFDKQT